MAFFNKRTPEEKKEHKFISDANFLGRRVVADPTDIKEAYNDRREDLRELQDAYSENNWKIAIGLGLSGFGASGLRDEFIEINDTNAVVEVPQQSQEDPGFTMSVEGGGSLLLAFVGAALIGSGFKGKSLIRSHIKDRLSKAEIAKPEAPAQG